MRTVLLLLSIVLLTTSCAIRHEEGWGVFSSPCLGFKIVGPVALYDEHVEKRQNTEQENYIRSLHHSTDPNADDLLIEQLQSGKLSYGNYSIAIYILGKRRSNKAVVPLLDILDGLKKDGDPWIARNTIDALGSIGDKRALPNLEKYYFESKKGFNEEYYNLTGHYTSNRLAVAIERIKEHNK